MEQKIKAAQSHLQGQSVSYKCSH